MLWESPLAGSTEWVPYEFTIQPETDINNLMFRSHYDQAMPAEIGYLLADNIRITPTPDLDIGNDTTICNNDSIYIAVSNNKFDSYQWSTGSNDTAIWISEPGIYWVEGIFGDCIVSDSIEVSVSPDFDLGNDTLICVGDTLNLAPGNFAQYLWFNGSTEPSISLFDPGDYLVWVLITDSIGCTAVDSLHLSIINDSTSVTLGNDTTICPGSELELYPGVYEGYNWSNGSNDSILTISEAGLYWVTVFGNCGSGSDTIQVSTFPPMNLNLGPDTTVCEESSITLDAGAGFENYFWNDSTTNQTNTVFGTGIYWVTVTDDHGCEATDTIVVGYAPAINVGLGQDTAICSGDDFLLSPGPDFISYTWQDGSTTEFIQISQPGTYWVNVIDQNGCYGGDTISISVNPSPTVDIGNDTVICAGSMLILEPDGNYASYLWQDNSTLPFYAVNESGLYTLLISNSFNCTAYDEVIVNISDPQVNLGADTIVCAGDTIVLDAGTGFLNYLWQDTSNSQNYSVDSTGTYSVLVTDQFGCNGSDSIVINWIPNPIADIQGGPLCEGDTIKLESELGPYAYFWNGEPGWPWLETSVPGWYELEVTNQCGTESDELLLEQFPDPYVNLGEDKVFTVGTEIILDAGNGFDSYLWQDGSTGQYLGINAATIDPGNPVYYVEVSLGPCFSSDTVEIVLFDVKVPIVITPNGDQKNDLFSPDPETWVEVNKHHIEVFNRWGEKVWESDHFEEGWDGKRNGKPVSDGTYFWVLELFYGENNTGQVIKGSLTVFGSTQ